MTKVSRKGSFTQDMFSFECAKRSNSKETAKDFTSDARRARERRGSILKYVTEERRSGNTAGDGKDKQDAVTIARRSHLYPYRTQKLSSLALMILGGRLPGKARRCRFFWSYGQAVKTPPFHGGNPGSIPGRITKANLTIIIIVRFFYFLKIENKV